MKREKLVYGTAFLFFGAVSLAGGVYMAKTDQHMKEQENDAQIEMMNLELKKSHTHRLRAYTRKKRETFKPDHVAVTFVDPPGAGKSSQEKTVAAEDTLEVDDEVPEVRYVYSEVEVEFEMAVIPPGTFWMGSRNGERDERPVHEVTVDGFLIGVREVTQQQYRDIMNTNPSRFKSPANPVEQVSWEMAAVFCNKLSEFSGLSACYDEDTWECDYSRNGFRLPTEAEWEYACRAGTTSEYHTGNNLTDLSYAAWLHENSDGSTHPVGSKSKNNWGLYDMHGNVWEWCNDWYDENYYLDSPRYNPAGPESGKFKIMRGGGWIYYPKPARSAFRGYEKPQYRFDYIGFRVVRRL